MMVLFVDGLAGESLETGNGNICDMSIQLFFGIFSIISFAGKTHTDTVGDSLDTTLPDSLVETGIHADILSSHGLLGKFTNNLDGLGASLLEGAKKKKAGKLIN